MFTFDVVSESVRNPHLLAAELTKRSGEGWEVVEIVYDGNTWLHAFIRHSGKVAVAPYPGMSPEEAAAPPATATPSTSQPLGTGSVGAPAQSAPSSGGASVPNPPANWYKDPSGRHELRYWNGSAWTEHVADGGRQSIDPPRA